MANADTTTDTSEYDADVVLYLTRKKAEDLSELIKIYGQYLQYVSPHKDFNLYNRLMEIKAAIADQL